MGKNHVEVSEEGWMQQLIETKLREFTDTFVPHLSCPQKENTLLFFMHESNKQHF